jgi:hypothetical protein
LLVHDLGKIREAASIERCGADVDVIRWRELEIGPNGKPRRRKCYEQLGNIPRGEAAEILRGKVAAGDSKRPQRSRVTFQTLGAQWERDVLPTKYKHSTQKNHRHIMQKHLLPRFGELAMCEVTTPVIQAYVTHLIQEEGYSLKWIDHILDVLSAVLRSGVKWGHPRAIPLSASKCRGSRRFARNGR